MRNNSRETSSFLFSPNYKASDLVGICSVYNKCPSIKKNVINDERGFSEVFEKSDKDAQLIRHFNTIEKISLSCISM